MKLNLGNCCGRIFSEAGYPPVTQPTVSMHGRVLIVYSAAQRRQKHLYRNSHGLFCSVHWCLAKAEETETSAILWAKCVCVCVCVCA